ncbi:MAG TPA: methylated-DNA--[protein]-cysteine S-methyltransferase [Candidatus Saccharimonadales bacterium]|nr:methylated-DNA--[protein]-cysteine S-methyltransferase [Candidatus Saccharimonadales bacterium]
MNDHLANIAVETPVGIFRMLTYTQKNTEFVVAAGFSEAAELQARLAEPLQSLHIEKTQTDHPYARKIKQYFAGALSVLSIIPHTQSGSVFSQAVWQTLETIPAGETISYGELARRSGQGAAVRAAGTACGKNHIILIVPCHRVIKSNGEVGSYLYGSDTKAWLLKHEANTGER